MSSQPLGYIGGDILRLSPNGTSGMFYDYKDRLSVWDSKGNIGRVRFSTPYPAYFFRDEAAICTQRGHFSIHSVPAETKESGVYGEDLSPGYAEEDLLTTSTTLGLKGYAYEFDFGRPWINLDNMLLLWLPAQYRPGRWEMVVCGDDYVVVEAETGVYSIRFKENARDFI